MRYLTEQETTEVSGGIGPVGGAIVGGIGYAAGNAMTGQNFSWATFSAAITLGAVTSGFSALGGALTGAASVARFAHASAIGTLASSSVFNVVSSISGGGGGGNRMATGSHIMDKYK